VAGDSVERVTLVSAKNRRHSRMTCERACAVPE
jgi:hypothetical protein